MKKTMIVTLTSLLLFPIVGNASEINGNGRSLSVINQENLDLNKRINLTKNITNEIFKQITIEYENREIQTEDEAFQRLDELQSFSRRGIYQVGNKRVNSDEVQANIFAAGFLETLKSNELADKALAKAEELNNELHGKYKGIHNGKTDAFRHAYWNALMSKDFGSNKAKIIADNHEKYNKGTQLENDMDYHNNDRGRRTYNWLRANAKDTSDKGLENRIKYDIDQGLMRYIKSGKFVPTNK